MKKHQQAILTIFIVLCPLWAGAQDFSKIDNFARSVELSQMSLPQLTDSLTKPYHTDLEKVRAVFVWIVHNIEYDYEKLNILESDTLAYLSNPLFDHNLLIKNILARKKGICHDYSFLFWAMCSFVDIEVKQIHGYAKTSYTEIGAELQKHAWNAALIEGKWHLMDATWARRHFSEFSVNSLDEGYFMTPPDRLILDHWPGDEQWQMLENTVTKDRFILFPHANSNYLHYKVQGFSPENGLIPANGQEITISLKIPQTERAVRLIEGMNVLTELIPVYENGSYKFEYSVSEETMDDNVSVAIENEYGSFDIILTYKLTDK